MKYIRTYIHRIREWQLFNCPLDRLTNVNRIEYFSIKYIKMTIVIYYNGIIQMK